MSQEKVLEALESLGLEKLDAQVYIFLGKRGPQKGKEIIKALKMSRQHLYPILKTLQNRGLVSATLEHPARFSAMPFEKTLDLFVEAKMEEAQQLQRGKAEILSNWKKISIAEISDQSPRFTIITGRKHIYPRLKQMVEDTKNQLSIITTVSTLVRAEQFGLIDAALDHFSETKSQFRFLTELTEENLKAMKLFLARMPQTKSNFQVRSPTLNQKSFSRMFIRDDAEVAFFIDNEINSNRATQTDDICLWTDCKDLVNSFTALFEDLWRDATDIQKRIVEIETGKPPPRTVVIKNADEAQKKYEEIMSSAQKSIYMITSSNGLIECWNDKNQTNTWIQKGVYARIMAPITNENLEATKQLMKICEVKHVPEGYVETTIIDEQHLFQFNAHIYRKETLESIPYFENTIYTDDAQYIEKTENMLNNIWENAQPPSPLTLGTMIQQPISTNKPIVSNMFDEYRTEFKKIVGLSYKEEPREDKIVESEVLKKIADAVRIPAKNPEKDTLRIYGTMGTVIIYPPKKLNLPNLMFQICCANKNSSFGVSNSLAISIQTNIADQQSYLQTAFITNNPKGYNFRKAMHKNQHTAEAVYLFNKNELAVHASTNGLFAGWTVPIPLLSEKYILPPANMIFEGSGEIRTYSTELKGLLNRRLIYEFNCLEAFVTFMLPSSRYYGPATDGLLYRECIITSYPPSTLKEAIMSE